MALEGDARAEVRQEEQEEQQLAERLEMVYGAIPIEGGVRFVCHAPGARYVRIAGDFNAWRPGDSAGEMRPTEVDGVWEREFRLPPGRYAYRLVIDGRWVSDPANPFVENNPYGELNSVVEISGAHSRP